MKASKVLKKSKRNNRISNFGSNGDLGSAGHRVRMTDSGKAGFFRALLANRMVSRAALARVMSGEMEQTWRDLDEEAQYPSTICSEDYKLMFERDPYGNRVIGAFSDACWCVPPFVYETEKQESGKQTPFEKGWIKLVEDLNLIANFEAFDKRSGILQYGVLLIGFNDGKDLSKIVQGISEDDEPTGRPKKGMKINFVTHFDADQAKIVEWQRDRKSKRFGLPLYYGITMADPENPSSTNPDEFKEQKVHWSRVIHCPSDGGILHRVLGTPRMKPVFNNLLNIRKILGGSAEMFLKAGFPALAFEVPAELAGEVELDKVSLEKEVTKFTRRWKKYLALEGPEVKLLNPTVADPASAVDVQVTAIAVAIGQPKRMLTGTEEARLASLQDSDGNNRKIHRRQNLYCTVFILRPFVNRCIHTGVLPKPKQVITKWQDVYNVSERDRAAMTKDLVAALAQYFQSGASKDFPPLQLYTMIMDLSTEQAEEIIKAAEIQTAKMKKEGTLVKLNPGDQVVQAGKGLPGQGMRPGQKSPTGSKPPSKQPKGGGKRIEKKPAPRASVRR
jgi:hypothetical protein